MSTPIERSETAGEAVGRAYARTTATLVAPIRRAPAPKWPRERVLARVTAARRRIRNVPRRMLNGLRVLLTRRRPDGTPPFKATKQPAAPAKKSAETAPEAQKQPTAKPTKAAKKPKLGTYLTTGFLAWWGWSWADAAGTLPWVYSTAAVTVASLAYAVGEEPPAREPKKEPKSPGGDTPKGPATDPLLALCATLIGDARGVHLDALCTALNEAAPNRQRTPSEVRAALGVLGVVTRPSVGAPEGAVPGAPRKVRRGVHREDLEAVIGPLPDPTPMEPADSVATSVEPALTCDVAKTATHVGAVVGDAVADAAEPS